MQLQELAKRFIPLQGLKAEKLRSLAKSVSSIKLSRGGLVFDFGDTSPYSYFLLQGELQLTTRDGFCIDIKPDDEQAAYPLANLLPRQMRARIRSDSAELLKIKREDLERLLRRDATTAANRPGITIRDLKGIPENRLSLLDTPLLSQLPPAVARRLLQKLETLHCYEGDVIFRENEPGKFFYFILNGSCQITRRANDREVTLCRLQALDSFGESALITSQRRNATVTMESDGELLRLGRSQFLQLLVQPLMRHTPADKAMRLVESGQARIIDIRSEQKFAQDALPEARNVPIYQLYLVRKYLSRHRHYITHGNDSRESTAAAFILLQRGLKVSVLGKAANFAQPRVFDALTLPGANDSQCA